MLKRFRRKGFSSSILFAILAIAAGIVMSIFLYGAYITLRDRMAVQSCRDSITAHSFISSTSVQQIFTDIKCPTREITIKNIKDTNPTIAEDMHRCWYEWGQGNGEYFQGDGVFCHICSIYAFSDKGQKVDGFIRYLQDTPIKVKYAGDIPGTTYSAYLKAVKRQNPDIQISQGVVGTSTVDSFDTSQMYATIFVYASGKDKIQTTMENGVRAGIFTGGIATGMAGGALTVGTVLSGGSIWVVIGGAAVAYAGAKAVGLSTTVKDATTLQQVVFRPYIPSELDSLGCEKLDVNQMSNR
jgi:hypothetical protein